MSKSDTFLKPGQSWFYHRGISGPREFCFPESDTFRKSVKSGKFEHKSAEKCRIRDPMSSDTPAWWPGRRDPICPVARCPGRRYVPEGTPGHPGYTRSLGAQLPGVQHATREHPKLILTHALSKREFSGSGSYRSAPEGRLTFSHF